MRFKELGKIKESNIAGIMLHGRGARPESVLSMGKQLENHEKMFFIAPEAPDRTNQWYPHSFLEPMKKNQPQLSESLKVVEKAIEYLEKNGFEKENIFLFGFSQGACLASEYIAQNPCLYKGLFALSGGIIGPLDKDMKYNGDLEGTEVFLGCSEKDPHIPLERVDQTERVFNDLSGTVEKTIYRGSSHNVNRDEIERISKKLK